MKNQADFYFMCLHKLRICSHSVCALSLPSCYTCRAPSEQQLYHTLFPGCDFSRFNISYHKVSPICPQKLMQWSNLKDLAVSHIRVVKVTAHISCILHYIRLLLLPGEIPDSEAVYRPSAQDILT